MTEIIQNNGEKFGEFNANYDGENAGLLQYEWKDDNTFNIVHTEVDENFGGKGIGKHLVSAAVDYARKEGKKMEATCTFAHSVLEKDASVKDVFTA